MAGKCALFGCAEEVGRQRICERHWAEFKASPEFTRWRRWGDSRSEHSLARWWWQTRDAAQVEKERVHAVVKEVQEQQAAVAAFEDGRAS